MKIINKIIFNMWIVISLIFILVLIIPLVLDSFKIGAEYYNTGFYELPSSLNFGNYQTLFNESKFFEALFNTIFISLGVIIATILFSSSLAYIVERIGFKYLNIYTFLGLFPLILLNITIFKVITALNLYDSYLSVIILYSFIDILSLYIFRDNISKIDQQIEEAALIDGLGYFSIYFKIILPNLKSSIIVVCIIKLITVFNDFYTQFLYLPNKRTLSTLLYTFIEPYDINNQVISASIVLTLACSIFFLVLIYKVIKSDNK